MWPSVRGRLFGEVTESGVRFEWQLEQVVRGGFDVGVIVWLMGGSES